MNLAYLSLGSNIEPERHLREAVKRLGQHGQVRALSTVWETEPVGFADQPNFLNAAVLLATPLTAQALRAEVIPAVEAALGRVRTGNKFGPRTIDIDLVLFDDQPLRLEYWQEAFMIVPLAELIPQFTRSLTSQSLAVEAENARRRIWIAARPEVLQGLSTVEA